MSGCPSTSVQVYEDCGAPAMGLRKYNALDPLAAAIKAAVLSSKPNGAPSTYPVVCEAMLRAGGLIYWKKNPGDCGSAAAPGGVTSGQIVGLSGGAASGVVGGLGAAGLISGPLTLGIGTGITLGVAGIEDLIAHHAQAVETEQTTICRVAVWFNSQKLAIDGACRSGQLTSDGAATLLKQVCDQAQSGLSSIVKQCNAACVFTAIIQAFSNFSRSWYDSIASDSPQAQSPAGPPSGYGTPPGGVTVAPGNFAPAPPVRTLASNVYAPALGPAPPLTQNAALPGNVGAVDYLNLGYNQQTGSAGQRADVPATGLNWAAIGAIAAVIALIITIFAVA